MWLSFIFALLVAGALGLSPTPQSPRQSPPSKSRRLALKSWPVLLIPHVANAATSLPEEARQGTMGAGNKEDSEPIPYEKYKKLPSGLTLADQPQTRVIRDPSKIVKKGSKVNVQWVLRKANGYFVDSSEVQGDVPFIFTVGDGTAIAGFDEGVVGMVQGGTRRLVVPLNLAYSQGLDNGRPGPLPKGFGPKQQIKRGEREPAAQPINTGCHHSSTILTHSFISFQ